MIIVLAIYVGSVMLVSLSAWRGQRNIEGGGGLGLPEIVVLAAQDPFAHLQEQGLDTVDGLVLSTKVDRKLVGADGHGPAQDHHRVHPSPDLAIQAALAGAQVTQAYTNFGARAASSYRAPATR